MRTHLFAFLLSCPSAGIPIESSAAVQPQESTWWDLDDPLVRAEVHELGLYPELVEEFPANTLQQLPLRSCSEGHVDFFDGSVRVRIESQVFDHPAWVQSSASGARLEKAPILGWTPNGSHRRLSRLEVVIDGLNIPIPLEAYHDLFDALLCSDDATVRYAQAARSNDGWRIYVHAQVGEGRNAVLVTWLFEDGHYRYRVVDRSVL